MATANLNTKFLDLNATPRPRPKLRWFQFSLRTLFIEMTLICVILAWFVVPAERQRTAIEEITKVGGKAVYAAPVKSQFWLVGKLREYVSRDYFDSVTRLEVYGAKAIDSNIKPAFRFTHLQSLVLRTNQVTDAGLINLRELTNLRTLELDGTQITDAGLISLSGLTQLHGLPSVPR